MAKTTLTVDIRYDPAVTDPEALACAMDRLLETILSTPGIMDEYADPKIGEFFVAGASPSPPTAPPRIVLDVSGGVLQEVYSSVSDAQVAEVDWDCEGADPSQDGIVEITDSRGTTRLAAVGEYPVEPMASLSGTETLAALEAAGLGWMAEPDSEVTVTRRWILYDFDTDTLATTNVYASYAEAAEDASVLNNVAVVPFTIEEIVVGAVEAKPGDEAPDSNFPPRQYSMRIDSQLLDKQREVLLRITDLARQQAAYTPGPGDGELLEGLLDLTDAIADQCHDQP